MAHIVLSRDAFFNNFSSILQLVQDIQKIAIVLKDNAYGHGLMQMATLANECKIPYAFVKNLQEALQIAKLFETVSIFYPNFSLDLKDVHSLPKNIIFCIANLEILPKLPKHLKIELKINTGMNRNGISTDKLLEALHIIQEQQLHLVGVFTHNAFGDDLDCGFFLQQHCFGAIKEKTKEFCKNSKLKIPRFHSLSSSGALRVLEGDSFNETPDDLYRFGIEFYGYCCLNPILAKIPTLKPVASLYASKISSQKLKQFSRVGYSGMGVANEKIVSSYDIGYGDGIFRLRDSMELHSAEGCRILPPISMDCLSAESDLESICVFNDANIWANAFRTIPYEILVHLNPNIPRILQ